LNYILHFLHSTSTTVDISKRKKYAFLKQLLHWVSMPLLSIAIRSRSYKFYSYCKYYEGIICDYCQSRF
jgi:hypothetical protein